MNPTLRNILAVIAGLIIGSMVNMGIIMISPGIIPPPAGVDVTNMEDLNATMHLFKAKHFIFPFLAHALGTLVGAFIAAKIAATSKMTFAIIIGAVFLLFGIYSVILLPGAPTWFKILDVVTAYIPMGWLGGKLALGK